MKIYICIYLMMFSCTSFAQIQRTVVKQKQDSIITEPASAKTNESRKEMFRELDLSKEQKLKMKEINQLMKAYKETIENNMALSETEKKEKLRSLRKEQVLKIQAILTEEQKIKFRQLKANKIPNG